MRSDQLTDLVPSPIGRAIDGLYEAIAAPETWTAALHRFARATDSVGCFFRPRNESQSLVGMPASPDVREFINAYVKEGWNLTDLNASRGWPLAAAGQAVVTDDDIATPEERRRSPYFQEFRYSWKFPHWAAIAFKVDGSHWCMPLLRADRQGPVSQDLMRVLERTARHLGHVIGLAKIVDRSQSESQLELLARIGAAAALVDWSGSVTALTRRQRLAWAARSASRRPSSLLGTSGQTSGCGTR
jgi:hypothetical protein